MRYIVEQEQGDAIQLRHWGVRGWLPKADVVLLGEAVDYFTARIRRDGKDAYAMRGWAHKEEGEFDQALADFDEAIRLQPEEKDWYTSRGTALRERRDDGRAFPDFDRALRLGPQAPLPPHN